MYHLGVSGYFHDSSVALLNDNGTLVDFKKEEWLSRVKGDKSFPRLSLIEMIDQFDLSDKNIQSVTFYEKPLKAWLTILKYSIKNNSLRNEVTRNYFKNIWKSSIIFSYDLSKYLKINNKKILYCDHHLSHTLSGLYYKNKIPAVSVVIDGFGDDSSSTIHHIKSSNEIIKLWSSKFPHSLGLFYSAITDYLGFAVNEGEYKVMGLAAYGKPIHYDKLIETINFQNGDLHLDTDYYDFVRSIQRSYSFKLRELFGVNERSGNSKLEMNTPEFQSYADIAASAQKVVEENLNKIFKYAYEITGERIFIFSGGVAMNSVAINNLVNNDFIDQIIIPPSPGDSGAAIGASYYGYLNNKKYNDQIKNRFQNLSLLTPGVLNQENDSEEIFNIKLKKISDNSNYIEHISKLISENKIIATCFKNIETGPRALGHRSLICSAHSKNAVKVLNENVKKRSSFRPTAPVILEKNAQKYFKLSQKIYESYYYMGAVVNVINSDNIEPVVHQDGTARVQICNETQFLGKILESLKKYNIDVIANTSFNISSDPMVYSKEDALLAIERMDIKYIVTEKGLYERE